MAIDDILNHTVGLQTKAGDKTCLVAANSVAINPGEPIGGVDTSYFGLMYVSSLYNVSASSTVTTGFTKPLILVDIITGVASSTSTQTATADGNVQITPFVQGGLWRSRFSLHDAFTFTGTTAVGSTTVTSVSSVSGLVIGQVVYDSTHATYIPTGTTITAINSAASTITLSLPAIGAGSGDTIHVYAPVLQFNATLATSSATATVVSGGLISGQSSGGILLGDVVSGTGITAGTTISAVASSSTLTLSAVATSAATGSAGLFYETLATTDGSSVTQAQYNSLVGCTALIEGYVSKLDGKYHYHIMPTTVIDTTNKNGLIIRYIDVTKYPGQVCFEFRDQVLDTF